MTTSSAGPTLAFRPRVLVVDDEKNIRSTLGMCLEGIGCEVVAVAAGRAAMAECERNPFDLAFVDLRLAHESGLDLIAGLLTANANLAIVIITAYADFDTAVTAVKRGAWDFLPKPFTPAQIRHLVEKLAERNNLSWRMADLSDQLADLVPEADLSSRSPAMRQAIETALRVAQTPASVLLRGENGTGKGVLARAIHAQSPRRARPFVVVNCPALSDELLASELFGHARGAFTNAVRDKPGRVETAQGGTLFLDEIGELPLALQVRLLRLLETGTYRRVGGLDWLPADFRLVAATHRDLAAMVQAETFRRDLYFRINTFPLRTPALHERTDDIPLLAASLLERVDRRSGRRLTAAALAWLAGRRYAGNIRELRNLIERATLMADGDEIGVEHLSALAEDLPPALSAVPPDRGPAAFRVAEPVTLAQLESDYLRWVDRRFTGSPEQLAERLGVSLRTLYRKRAAVR